MTTCLHEGSAMALVHAKRSAQITLPAELRKQFHLEEDNYLDTDIEQPLT
jgi:bifunctional DNA-binding transcriptional regulator/antitoxin component of YhaV-PrlF toxin-antitoxin module